MILKLIIFAIVAILIYKFFGGKFPTFGKSPHEKKLDDDTLVECTKCHTYVTVKESIVVGGKYYCSTECTP
jgi:uncharacterized protein